MKKGDKVGGKFIIFCVSEPHFPENKIFVSFLGQAFEILWEL